MITNITPIIANVIENENKDIKSSLKRRDFSDESPNGGVTSPAMRTRNPASKVFFGPLTNKAEAQRPPGLVDAGLGGMIV
jgi:hypothetical protein